MLNLIVKGGYTVAKGSVTCANPWYQETTSYGLDMNKMTSQCDFSRKFVFSGATTLKVGDVVSFYAGFNKWSTTEVTKTTQV